MDRGEAEVIALAAELKADWLLIDERAGRLFARHAGLRIVGVLGILIRAKFEGRIPSIKPEMANLRSEAHFFIGRDLEHDALAAAGE